MKSTLLKLSILVFLVLGTLNSKSSHIVGGELLYNCMGPVAGSNPTLYRFAITLKLYRDCQGIPFSTSIQVNLWDYNGTNKGPVTLTRGNPSTVPPVINNPCLSPPAGICVQEAIYTGFINLPPSPGGYTMQAQQCCRNFSVENIISPGSTGATYTTKIPSPNSINCNSNPQFNSLPPIVLCKDDTLNYDHSAIDADGDSLSYKLCWPYDDGVNGPPPYPHVVWKFPYSTGNPMGGAPPISINPETGILVVKPTKTGQFVVGVCVEEWRNGIKINTSLRDFQFNVVECIITSDAIIPSQLDLEGGVYICSGTTATFGNESIDAYTFFWDFGVINDTLDTSTQQFPTYTFPDTGSYLITLTINPGLPCEDDTAVVYHFLPPLYPDIDVPEACFNHHSIDFFSNGQYDTTASFLWNFNAAATPGTSTNENEFGVTYPSPGEYLVTLAVSQHGCTRSDTDTLVLIPNPVPDLFLPNNSGCAPFNAQFFDNSTYSNPLQYKWFFGDGDSSTVSNPSHLYTNPGVYDVTLKIQTTTGCVDTVDSVFVAAITVDSLPIPIYTTSPFCDGLSIYFNDTSVRAATYAWDFGDPNSMLDVSALKNPSYVYSTAGRYAITLTVTSSNGCAVTTIDSIDVAKNLFPDFAVPAAQCLNVNNFDFIAAGQFDTTATFLWAFPGALTTTSLIKTPRSIVYSAAGTYPVSLTVTQDGCSEMVMHDVTVLPSPTIDFTNDIFSGCAPLTVNFTDLSSASEMLDYLWDFGDGNTSVLQNPQHVYTLPGNYSVTLTIIADSSCSEILSLTKPLLITVVSVPLSDFDEKAVCDGLSYEFANKSQGAAGFLWDFGDGNTSSLANPTHTYSAPGNYTVELLVNPTQTCQHVFNKSIDVVLTLDPTFDKPDVQCIIDNSFDFVAKGKFIENEATFEWTFGNPGDATIATSSNKDEYGVEFLKPTTIGNGHQVMLRVTQGSCTETHVEYVDVYPNPLPIVDLTGGSSCAPYTALFTNNTVTSTPVVYTWNFGDGTTSNDVQPTHLYTRPGSYDITLTAQTFEGCVDSVTKVFEDLIVVYANPVAKYTFSPDPQNITIITPEVSFYDNSVGHEVCEWYIDGNFITDECDFDYVFPDGGTYLINHKVISEFGCEASVDGKVVVRDHLLFAPNAFTPNNDGDNDGWKPIMKSVLEYELLIFDRWGEMMFTTTDQNAFWNGTTLNNNKEATSGQYAYIIRVRDSEKILKVYDGVINLLR